jgi:hypothetical protein
MHTPRALLFASTLSLLPIAAAQSAPAAEAATAQDDELRFRLGDLVVRRFVEGGTVRAEASRDGGRTFRPLADPDDRLHFVLAQYDPLVTTLAVSAALGAPAGNRLFLVQFQTQLLAEYQDVVRQQGVEILHYMPENALFVRCDRAAAMALRTLPCVRWVGDLQNAHKLDAALRAFVESDATAALECNLILASKADRARLAAQVAGLGGEVTNLCDGSVMLQARLSPAQLLGVLALDTVTWADPTTAVGYDMDNARIQGGGNHVETAAGYTGSGVRAEITEGFDETHPDWTNTPVIRSNQTASHGHCTAGIVGGNGSGNAAARGMMPNCQLIEGPYSASGHYAAMTGSTNPALAWRSMVATASWGSAQTTVYTSISQTVDDALFDSDLTRTQSQSNTNNQNSRPEAWAKNIISVGGVVHGNNSTPADDVWNGASIGPASDGRIKPDICAYYEGILTSDLQGASGYASGNYYSNFGGTSGATPIVAGHVGLIQQMFTDGLFGNALPLPPTDANRFANKPHMSTSKALLCNTASQYSFSGAAHNLTRTHQGWGFPSLQRLYDNRKRIVVVDEYEALQQGQSRSYFVHVAPGTGEFRATMVYTDPEAQANAAIHRVNNANLRVTRLSDGTSWWGNNGLGAGNFSTSGGVANDRDNLEAVYLGNPTAGTYLVTVEAPSIVRDAKVETPQMDLDFALVFHPTGGGYRNDTGMQLDLVSTGAGNLSVNVANVPAAGWTDGYTFFSFSTTRPLAFGRFFGIEDDFITTGILGLPASAGDVLHFTNAGAAQFPFTAFTFPPSLISALAGIQVDGVVTLFNAGQIVAQSNVDRVAL